MKSSIFYIMLLLVAIAAQTTNDDVGKEFVKWMTKFGKAYSHDQFQYRYQIFRENYHFVQQHNSEKHSFTVGLNEFSDLTNLEFIQIYNGYSQRVIADSEEIVQPTIVGSDVDSIDWVSKGAVTPVKNQGQCGSCWAFSTTGSLEGALQIAKGKLVSLSEQNLIDCSANFGNMGCSGGLMDNAFKYVINNKGLDTEASYPYKAASETCKYNSSSSGIQITGYKNINGGDEAGLTAALLLQPVSVAIDASQPTFRTYQNGVYYEPSCSSSRLDHGVLAVGFGVEQDGTEYYLVKNSWGPSWGQQGFIKMIRNKGNNCGIASAASYPTGVV